MASEGDLNEKTFILLLLGVGDPEESWGYMEAGAWMEQVEGPKSWVSGRASAHHPELARSDLCPFLLWSNAVLSAA